MTASGSAVATAASSPPSKPDVASAPTCSDWFEPSAWPCWSDETASEMIAAAAGRQIATSSAVSPEGDPQRALCDCGITIDAMATASIAAPDAAVCRGVSRRESQATIPRFATTIGTATQADEQRLAGHAHVEAIDEVHRVDAEEPEDGQIEDEVGHEQRAQPPGRETPPADS